MMIRGQPAALWKWSLLLVAATAVSIVALMLSARLRIDTNLVELFPDSPVAQDYRSFLDRFGGFEKIYVVVSTSEEASAEADPEARAEVEAGIAENLADAAEYLAALLEESDRIGSTRYGLTDEDERFMFEAVLPRAPLLLDENRLRTHLQRLGADAPRQRRGCRSPMCWAGHGRRISSAPCSLVSFPFPPITARTRPSLQSGGT